MSTKTRPDDIHWRVRLIAALVTVLFVVVIVRSFLLQIKEHKKLERLSRLQSLRSVVIKGPRGPILDCGGEYLALSVKSYSVYAIPKMIKNKRRVSAKLGKVLGESPWSIHRKLKKRSNFVWIKRKLPKDIANRVKKLGIKGTGVIPEYRRVYPKGRLFRCIIGSVGSELQGLSGLELAYDDLLKERVLKKTGVIRDAKGNLISLGPAPSGPVAMGIKLTLDARVGAICEEELERGVKTSRARSGMAIVMNPKTGAIIAMASYPPCENPVIGRNPIYSKLIEPGSTIKPFILAEALQVGKVKRDTIIDCGSGSMQVSGHTIHDAHPYTNLTAEDVVVKSSNVGISRIALMEGKDLLISLFKRLNLVGKTGIDIAGEEGGIMGGFNSNIDIACKAFGQGISTTFLSLVNAFSVFANGGLLPRPYTVSWVVDENGRPIRRMELPSMKRVFSEDVANMMRIVLRKVVVVGTGKRAEIQGFDVCGKTGTSQKLEKSGVYSKTRFYSIFIGFFPMEDPRLLIGVLVDEPRKGHYGGEVAAPIFKRIGERLIAYYGITPFGPVKNRPKIQLVSRKNKQEMPVAGKGTMPNLKGLVLRKALKAVNGMGVPVKLVGKGGFVVSQSPPPGTPKRMINRVTIRLGGRL